MLYDISKIILHSFHQQGINEIGMATKCEKCGKEFYKLKTDRPICFLCTVNEFLD